MFNLDSISLIFPIAGAICGAMLWLNYFLKIDVFESERTIDVILALCVGYLTPEITLWVYKVHTSHGWDFNGFFWNDLFYSIAGVGLTEEISKLIGVSVVFLILRKRMNEPIDYLIFGGIIALGFSVRENFIYFSNYGTQLITGRTLISSLTHIINTSICVYGFIRFGVFNKGNIILNSTLGILISIVSHGLFDFFLTQPVIGSLTPFLASIVYLIGINFWIQMINNCINFSPFFNYEKLAKATKLYKTILGWYFGLLIIEFGYVLYLKNLETAIIDVFKNIFKEGVLLLIVALRVSRLRINKRKYFGIKIQLPIYITKNNDEDINILGFLSLKVRGENESEFGFLKYMGKDILVCPLNYEDSVLKTNRKGSLLKKYFLKNDVVSYLLELYKDENNEKEIYIIKPKTNGIKLVNNQYPVAGLMFYNQSLNILDPLNPPHYKDFDGFELVYVKSL